jgi:hypothetical protein
MSLFMTRWFGERRDRLNSKRKFASAWRPALEALESRYAPAVRIWTGLGADDLWSNAANWDTGVAQDGDDVRIAATAESGEVLFDSSVTGGGVTLNSLTSDGTNAISEPLRITADALALSGAGPFAIGNTLTLQGGEISGTANVSIGAGFEWSGGVVTGAGTTTLLPSSIATLSTSEIKRLGRTLVNQGTISYSGSFFQFGPTADSIGVIDNQGVFNAVGDGDFDVNFPNTDHAFNNAGTFNRSGAATTGFAIRFNTSGPVHVGAGTLQIFGGGSSTGTAFTVADGAVLNFDSSYSLNAASSVSGAGAGAFTAGLITVDGTYTLTGVTTIIGTVSFTTATTFPTLNLSAGFLVGSADFTVTTLNWTGGSIGGVGTLTLPTGATATISSNDIKRLGRTLVNQGTIDYVGDFFQFGPTDGSVGIINNQGVFNVTAGRDFSLNFPSPSHAFNNAGTFNRSGAFTTRFDIPFNTSGPVNVGGGTLRFSGGGSSAGAAFAIAEGAILDFNSSYQIDAASTISGAGAGKFTAGTVTIDGVYTLTGATSVSAGVNFNTATSFSTLNLSGSGTLAGSANLVVTSLNWSSGSMLGAGTLTLPTGAAATLSTSDIKRLGRTLVNLGTIDYIGNFFQFGPVDGAVGVINNQGVFNAIGAGDLDVNFPNASHAFNNIGVFNRSGTAATDILGIQFSNSGTINVLDGLLNLSGGLSNFSGTTLTGGAYNISGALRFAGANIVTNAATVVLDGATASIQNSGGGTALANFATNAAGGSFTIQNGRNVTAAGFTNAGSVTIGAGSTFTTAASTDYLQTGGSTTLATATSTLAAGGIADIQAGSLSGLGTVEGSLQQAGQLNPGTSPGILTNDGDTTQTGVLNIEIGGIAPGTEHDQLIVTGNVNLGGTLNVTLVGSFFPATGDSFRIVDNTGAAAIAGTFTNLTEGAILTVGAAKLHVSYVGGSGNDVVLTAINLEPTLDAIADPPAFLEDAGPQTINLAGITAGGGESQSLTVTATSDNPTLIPNPSVTYVSPDSTGSLSYAPLANQFGTAVITVTVTDGGGTSNGGVDTISRTFTVVVQPVNDAPGVAAPIVDLTVTEDAAALLDHAALNAVFADVDNLDAELTYSVHATTPGGIVTATIDADDTLDLGFAANAFGDVDITVRATDPDGLFVEDTFHVTVNPVNDAPTVTSPIVDRIVPTSAPPVLNHVDLNAAFADIDDAELTYTVSANTNAGLVTVTVEADDTLDLSFTAAQNGVAEVTVRATDAEGLFVEDTFHVTVKPPVATTTTVTQASPAPSTFGDAVTFTATVTPNEGTDPPAGTVTFKDGATTLGVGTLSSIGGVATAAFTTSPTQLDGGSHTITAVYSGLDAFVASTSPDFNHNVNHAATTVTITNATPSLSVIGQFVTFTVTVTSTVSGILPTGTVIIKDGAVTLGTSTALTNVNGIATVEFTTAPGQLAVGAHTITAEYAGDDNFIGSTSPGFVRLIAPLTALPDVYTVKKNRRLRVLGAAGLLLNDVQASGLAKLAKKPVQGKLKLNADGSFIYTPAPGFVGKITFKYRIVSAFGVSAPTVVTIRVKR